MAADFGDEYLEISPRKTILIPHAPEVLEYLSGRYALHILTNGFRVTQQIKLKHCGLDKYFRSLTTSEDVGHNKPRPEIFRQALSSVHARKEESIMVGDDLEVDIIGARKFGIDQVFFNRDGLQHNVAVTYEITSLTELKELF
jgi:putative hydrolase of the HAD superfamily